MAAGDQHAFARQLGERILARLVGQLFVAVKAHRDSRRSQLYPRYVDEVTEEGQTLAVAIEYISGMPCRMARRGIRIETGNHLAVMIERDQLAGIAIWLYRCHRALEERLAIGLCGPGMHLRQPELGIGLSHVHGGMDEHGVPIGD